MNKLKTHVEHSLEIDGTEYELRLAPDSPQDAVVRHLDDGRVVIGYLIRDEDCENPLENDDGAGSIWSLSNRHRNRISVEEATEKLENSHMVVPLSYFEHGNCMWGVRGSMGGMPDFCWDGTSFAGIWEPNRCCIENIQAQAAKQLGVQIEVVETACCSVDPQHSRPWKLKVGRQTFSKWSEATQRAMAVAKKRRGGAKSVLQAESAVAREFAQQACESYTAWCNGDCHGVIVVTCEADGTMIDSDECWGFVGYKYAMETLNEQVNNTK